MVATAISIATHAMLRRSQVDVNPVAGYFAQMTNDERLAARVRAKMREIEVEVGPHMVADMEFRRRLTPETDRGAALAVRAYLEHRLGELLRAALVHNKKLEKELYGGNGPLAVFSARINVAYSIGLLSADEMRNLHLIRAIANAFAHEPGDITFADPEVVSRCANLSAVELRDIKHGCRPIFVTTAMLLLSGISRRISDTSRIQERPNSNAMEPEFTAIMKTLAARAADARTEPSGTSSDAGGEPKSADSTNE
jgi:DNA-binding MltR family transcriptional regulator